MRGDLFGCFSVDVELSEVGIVYLSQRLSLLRYSTIYWLGRHRLGWKDITHVCCLQDPRHRISVVSMRHIGMQRYSAEM